MGVGAHRFTAFVYNTIPSNFVGAVSGDNILAALLVSIMFGTALNMSGEQGKTLAAAIEALSTVVFRIVGWVMRLAPIGTFGAWQPMSPPTASRAFSSLATSSWCSPAPASRRSKHGSGDDPGTSKWVTAAFWDAQPWAASGCRSSRACMPDRGSWSRPNCVSSRRADLRLPPAHGVEHV